MKRIATIAIVAIMLVSLMASALAEERTVKLDLQFTDLEPLDSGHYEGWLIVDGQPVSTGKFNVNAAGDLVDLDGKAVDYFHVKGVDLDAATMFVLSIEPEGDDDALPATIKPLAGSLDSSKETADLSANLGVDLSGISGRYILATPSDNFPPDDYDLELEFDGLPMLTTGHYEGWLIVDGAPVSTGKFNVDVNGNLVDLQGNAIEAFTLMDLDATMVEMFVLSIEEEGDDDAVPGAVKPLAGAVDGTGLAGTIAHTVGVDLSGADGVYILATPSNNDDYYLDLSFENLAPLATGHYEGWLIVDGAPVSTGKFNVDAEGDLVDHLTAEKLTMPFLVMDIDASKVEMFVLSIEPEGDDDDVPGAIKPLAGAVDGTGLAGGISHTIGVDLTSAGGEYILATPSDGGETNELSGIWYLNRSTGTPVAGLDLPDLSGSEWTYEGWVVIDGLPVTSGRFNMSEGFDDFDGYSASDMYPPFPGEDFLMNAPEGITFPTNLSGQLAVISVEPRMDDDPAPFLFKPLVGLIPGDAVDHLEYQLDNVAETLPTGTFALSGAPSDENSGIWFLDRSSGTPVAGLDVPDLSGTDWQYEGWVVIDGVPVTSGRFDTAEGFDDFDGYSASDAYPPFPGEDFLVNAPDGVSFPTDLAGKTAVISIEPRVDDDPAPFLFKPLVGAIPEDATDHLEYDLDLMDLPTGSFMLTQHEAPQSNELSGIWFLDLSTGSPTVGLDLPDLIGTDWQYEGWVVIDGVPVSTGRFDSGDGFDDFDGHSASDMYPPFPGEDFLMNAPSGLTFPTDLSGAKAVISIEPRMDDDPGPFMFKPLAGDIPVTAQDHVVYDLMDRTSDLPRGTVSITEVAEDEDGSSDLLLWGIVAGAAIVLVIALAVILSRRSGQ